MRKKADAPLLGQFRSMLGPRNHLFLSTWVTDPSNLCTTSRETVKRQGARGKTPLDHAGRQEWDCLGTLLEPLRSGEDPCAEQTVLLTETWLGTGDLQGILF